MDNAQKVTLLQEIALLRGGHGLRLKELGIPLSTYYTWKQRYEQGGVMALSQRNKGGPTWNRLTDVERDQVLAIARLHPELSCRLLAVKITDEEAFAVSESTVFRLLKKHGMITPRSFEAMPAAKEWRHKTTHPDEIWQSDATHYFVVGWGFYPYRIFNKQITVQDDYSRNPLARDVKPDETAFSISDVMEQAIENATKLRHLQDGQMPQLLSDNGPGLTSKILNEYLHAHGIEYIFGAPYYPQTQGTIERFQRNIKERVYLFVYCSPEEFKQGIDETITRYARTPHTALKNVSPLDIYMDSQEEILQRRT